MRMVAMMLMAPMIELMPIRWMAKMVNAVLELGFVHPISDRATELLDRVAEFIGVAVQAAEYRSNLQNFLDVVRIRLHRYPR